MIYDGFVWRECTVSVMGAMSVVVIREWMQRIWPVPRCECACIQRLPVISTAQCIMIALKLDFISHSMKYNGILGQILA